MSLVLNTALDSRYDRLLWRCIIQLFGSNAYRFYLFLNILLPVSLYVYSVEHAHLSSQLLGEVNIILLLLSEIVHFYGS